MSLHKIHQILSPLKTIGNLSRAFQKAARNFDHLTQFDKTISVYEITKEIELITKNKERFRALLANQIQC